MRLSLRTRLSRDLSRIGLLDSLPVDSRRSIALVCGNRPPGTLRDSPLSTDRVFSARRVTRPYRSSHLCPQIPPASKTYRSPVPLRLVNGFPALRLLRGLRPVRALPRPPRIACPPLQADTHGSHVPVLNPRTLRCLLYPWRALGRQERRSRLLPGTGLFVPSRRDDKTHPDHATFPPCHPTTKRGIS